MSRRFFPLLSLASVFLSAQLLADTPIRIMAGNLSSGPKQSYDFGHGARIIQALKPDVLLLQEFNYGDGSPQAIQSWVAQTLGPEYKVVREQGKQIPNGIVSRFPVLESGDIDDPKVNNREFAYAKLDIPGQRELWAISVHLLTKSPGLRLEEAKVLADFIKNRIPQTDYVVLGGDFNTNRRDEPCIAQLSQVLTIREPFPTDQQGKSGTNAGRSKPYDWVVGDYDLDRLEVPVKVGQSAFPHGLVFDSRTFTPLSAVAPVQPDDSAAPQMQHMAVVRQFLVP